MSLDKTLKAIGLRKKTPADKVREAGAKRRGARGAARAQRLQDAGGAARDPVLGRPTTHDHEPLSNDSSAVVS